MIRKNAPSAPPKTALPRLLSLRECAAITGESTKSWQRRIAAREVEYVAMGPHRLRVPIVEVKRIIAERTVKSNIQKRSVA